MPSRSHTIVLGALSGALAVSALIAPAQGSAAPSAAGSDRRWAAAVDTPVADDMFPAYGSLVVDALHYGLDLTWRPHTRTLEGRERLTFRAARGTRTHFALDLSPRLHVRSAALDGHRVRITRSGHKLRIWRAVTKGSEHTVALTYAGVPHSVSLQTTRSGTFPMGWMTNAAGEAYALQEPYGAFTWYAANDQPSDKAFYDFTISAPRTWVGVANGRLVARSARHGRTITRWHLGSPASSYLTTIGVGPYRETVDHSVPGLPITYWTSRSRPGDLTKVRYAATAVRWLEQKLGRFPFSTLGILVAPEGGMETQTMITLGRNAYTLSKDTITHEIAHQWFGDEVSPLRWSDAWLNESWATYLAEGVWSAHEDRARLNGILAEWNANAARLRARGGPPARPYRSSILDGNIYYIPALMWDLVRQRLGDALFWRLAAAWPRDHRYGSADYATALAWWNAHSGRDLTPLFHSWLLARAQPNWTPPPGSSSSSPRAQVRPLVGDRRGAGSSQ